MEQRKRCGWTQVGLWNPGLLHILWVTTLPSCQRWNSRVFPTEIELAGMVGFYNVHDICRIWKDVNIVILLSCSQLVRDSSAVWRLFVRLAGAVGRQSAQHKENSGFAAPTLGQHISTFRGYQILFSIRNPYINRFTNHFSI